MAHQGVLPGEGGSGASTERAALSALTRRHEENASFAILFAEPARPAQGLRGSF